MLRSSAYISARWPTALERPIPFRVGNPYLTRRRPHPAFEKPIEFGLPIKTRNLQRLGMKTSELGDCLNRESLALIGIPPGHLYVPESRGIFLVENHAIQFDDWWFGTWVYYKRRTI